VGGIKLVKESERLVLDGDGFKIFYRRVPSPVRGDITRRATPRRGGDPDWTKVSRQMLTYAILDWEGVFDDDNQAVPYSPELAENLPEEIQVELLEKVGQNIDRVQAESKNSGTTSDSNT